MNQKGQRSYIHVPGAASYIILCSSELRRRNVPAIPNPAETHALCQIQIFLLWTAEEEQKKKNINNSNIECCVFERGFHATGSWDVDVDNLIFLPDSSKPHSLSQCLFPCQLGGSEISESGHLSLRNLEENLNTSWNNSQKKFVYQTISWLWEGMIENQDKTLNWV